MKWMPYATALLSVAPIIGHSAVYLTAEQAQKLMFPNTTMKKVAVRLTNEQIKSLKKSSGIFYAFKADQVQPIGKVFTLSDGSTITFLSADPNTGATVRVQRSLDKEPPMVGLTLSSNANAVAGFYDTLGRYIHASVTMRF